MFRKQEFYKQLLSFEGMTNRELQIVLFNLIYNSKKKRTTHSKPPSKKTFIYIRGSKIVTIESFVTFNSITINHSVAWNGTTMPSYPSLTKPFGPSSCSIQHIQVIIIFFFNIEALSLQEKRLIITYILLT